MAMMESNGVDLEEALCTGGSRCLISPEGT